MLSSIDTFRDIDALDRYFFKYSVYILDTDAENNDQITPLPLGSY